jgi:serpin B
MLATMKRRAVRSLPPSVLLVLGLAGCGTDAETASPPPAQELRSNLQRDTSPQLAPGDLEALVGGNTQFTLDLYRAVSSRNENLFFSPHSISVALAMVWGGARGSTEQQMASTLHFTLGQGRQHPAFNALDLELARRGQGASGHDGKEFRLRVMNGLWGQVGHPFLDPFLDLLAVHYGAGLLLVDFKHEAEAARLAINAWIEEQTEERIQDMIPPGVLQDSTRLVLTNAIYFSAGWKFPFDPQATHPADFELPGGGRVQVPTMTLDAALPVAQGDGFEAFELPYDCDELGMVVILPERGRLAEIESGLSAGWLEGVLDDLGTGSEHVLLSLPKFTFRAELDLKSILVDLGMPVAFSELADFSGIDGKRDLVLTDVLHQAFVAVDEYGTEAAAATVVVVGVVSAPRELRVDRPFLFLIRDRQSGAILFLGRVLDPRD